MCVVIVDLILCLWFVDCFEFDLMGMGEVQCDFEWLVGQFWCFMVVYMSGELVCIFGIKVMGILFDVGCFWVMMMWQVDWLEVWCVFIVNFGLVVDWLGQDVWCMWNLVVEENVIVICWLKWLGFCFDGRVVIVQGYCLLYFEMEMKDVC